MTGFVLLLMLAMLGLWIAAAVRGPGGESRQDRARQDHLLALAVGAGTALVLFALLQVTAREGMPYSATPWHTLLCTVLGLGLWAGFAGYLQGREWLLPGAIALQFFCVGTLVLLPFGFDHQSEWGLDVDHALLLLMFYGLAAIAGVMLANVRRPGPFWLQIGLLLVGLPE